MQHFVIAKSAGWVVPVDSDLVDKPVERAKGVFAATYGEPVEGDEECGIFNDCMAIRVRGSFAGTWYSH